MRYAADARTYHYVFVIHLYIADICYCGFYLNKRIRSLSLVNFIILIFHSFLLFSFYSFFLFSVLALFFFFSSCIRFPFSRKNEKERTFIFHSSFSWRLFCTNHKSFLFSSCIFIILFWHFAIIDNVVAG